jgi:hypothetical protein
VSVIALVGLAGVVAPAAPVAAAVNEVTNWNRIATTTLVQFPLLAGGAPPALQINMGMVQGAVYDAVNAIDRGHQPYLVQPPSNPTDSKEAAAATAAFRVLVGIFPEQLGTLQPLYDAYIAGLPDNPPGSKAAGITIGEMTAAAMLQARMNDGRFGPPPLHPLAPGVWRPTPPNYKPALLPQWRHVTPFALPDLYVNDFGQGIWRSLNNGATWTQILAPLAANLSTDRAEFDVTTLPNGNTRMYVGVGNQSDAGANRARFYRTDDASGAALFVDMTTSQNIGYCTGQCWYDNVVYTPAGAPAVVYLGGSFSYGQLHAQSNGRAWLLSTDGGSAFSDLTQDGDPSHAEVIHPDQHAIVTVPGKPLQFIRGSDGGVGGEGIAARHVLDQVVGEAGVNLRAPDERLAEVDGEGADVFGGLLEVAELDDVFALTAVETALPQPPKTSQKVPRNSAPSLFVIASPFLRPDTGRAKASSTALPASNGFQGVRPGGISGLGDAEVDDLGLRAAGGRGHQDVRGLEVAVDDPPLMRVLDRRKERWRTRGCLRFGEHRES